MPIIFDEVSAEIDRQPTPAPAPAPAESAPAAPPAADLRTQLEYALDLRAARQARLCDD